MTVIKISTIDELHQYCRSNPNTLVILKFGADWCSPCRAYKPVYEEFAAINPQFIWLTTDDQCDLTADLEVQSLPTTKLFRNGVCVETIVGFSKDKLEIAIRTK